MLSLPDIRALTFDCYGTLIDWETGILTTLRPLFPAASDADLLTLYAHHEAAEEAGSYKPYHEVLANVLSAIAAHYKHTLTDNHVLADSLPSWPVFPDTRPFLTAAAQRYTLCVCSNIDDDLWAGTHHAINVPIDRVVTAQYCRSYKPDPRHFRVALALLDLEPHQVLHVAESRRHDIAPAKALGFQTAWVNRHKHRPGPSASGHADAVPDLEIASLDELAGILGLPR
ncbi:MAG TPA: HAD-IA family hydrolase [Phycisphaerales bacterium]|nr:HAD-IA family hydrolase [Phycisphaerales bacterium]